MNSNFLSEEELESYLKGMQQNSINQLEEYKKDYKSKTEESIQIFKAEFPELREKEIMRIHTDIRMLKDVQVDVSVVLGKTKSNIKDILELQTGSIIKLDKLVDGQVDVLVNERTIAMGEIVVVDLNFGVKIAGIISLENKNEDF